MTFAGTALHFEPIGTSSQVLADQRSRHARAGRAWTIELAVAVLLGLGLVLVWSASGPMAAERHGNGAHFLMRQALWSLLALGMFAIASRLPLRAIEGLAWLGLPVATAALVALLIPGVSEARGGAHRWLALGPLSVQPAEPAKLALVLFLARWLSRLPPPRGSVTALALVVTAIPAGLVFLQPDLGTAVILVASSVLLLFLAGARLGHLALPLAAALPALVWAVIHSPYRFARILAFWDPWKHARSLGYQVVQSFVAFGSGGVTGRGLGAGHQKLFYLPESHTDFVFAVLGEELGFVGVACVAVLFFLLVVQGARVALAAESRFGYLLAAGLICLLGVQAAANMAVALGLVPTKGLALPFLSYGGSALVTSAVALGLVLAVDRASISRRGPRGALA